jgi:MoxR-like ATPase
MNIDYTFTGKADYNFTKEQRKDNDGRYYDPYIPSPELVEAVNLAIDLGRPLLIEGEPGCGKTRLANAIAYELTQKNLWKGQKPKPDQWWPFYDWRVKSYTRSRDGLYTFDAIGRLRDAQMAGTNLEKTLNLKQIEELQERLQSPEKYRKFGALGLAFQEQEKRAVVLIDEVDKADSDFANDLLLELDEFRFEIAETGEKIQAPQTKPPIIILTSNRDKPLPDAFLRRCLYFELEFPKQDKLIEIAKQRLINFQDNETKLVNDAIKKFEQARNAMNQPGSRPPGTSEFLDFIEALRPMFKESPDRVDLILKDLPLPFLGILLKTKSDRELYQRKSARKAG